jgi:hypothetical protein
MSMNDLMAAWQGVKSLFWLKTKKDLFKRQQ